MSSSDPAQDQDHHHPNRHACGCPHDHAAEDKEYQDDLARLMAELPPSIEDLPLEEQSMYMDKIDALIQRHEDLQRERKERHEAFQEMMRERTEKFKQAVKEGYQPLHPHLYRLEGWKWEEKFNHALAEHANALSSNPPNIKAARQALLSLISQPRPGVYVFDCLHQDTCEELVSELEHFEKWCASSNIEPIRPNSMNRYGAILDDIGFESTLQALVEQKVAPFAPYLFPWTVGFELNGKDPLAPLIPPSSSASSSSSSSFSSSAGNSPTEAKQEEKHEENDEDDEEEDPLNQSEYRYFERMPALPSPPWKFDSHHGFVVDYEIGKDTALDFHVDDADVTLNLCLGRGDFSGGDLFFGGVRCEQHTGTQIKDDEDFTLEHKLGRGILHLGAHRHAAKPLTSGKRTNLILWCRNSAFRTHRERVLLKAEFDNEEPPCPFWCGINPNPQRVSIDPDANQA